MYGTENSGKFIETESRVVVGRDGGDGEMGVTA